MMKRKASPNRRPSIVMVRSRTSNIVPRHGFAISRGNTLPPKTRFSLNGRSNSSPRLKSFPPEKINKTESKPGRNSQERANAFQPMQNAGQNGTIGADLQQTTFLQIPDTTNQNVCSSSNQDVRQNIYPAKRHANQNNQSEITISSPMDNILRSNDKRIRRPFASNVPDPNMTFREERSCCSRKAIDSGASEHQQTVQKGQICDPWKIENDSVKPLDVQKGEVTDRSVDNNGHNAEKTNGIRDRHEEIFEKPSFADPNIPNINPVMNRPTGNFSLQNYPTYHPNSIQYLNDNRSGITRNEFDPRNGGVTSSQHNWINNHWKDAQLRSSGWIDQRQSPCMKNGQFLYQPYSMGKPDVNANLNSVPNFQKCLRGNWQYQIQQQQKPQLQQYYYQEQDQRQQNMELQEQQQQLQHQYHHQHYQMPDQFPQISPYNEKTAMSNQIQMHEESKRRSFKFTPSMIQDQELLVKTMRQQGIAEDIMKRQFDGLLSEQKKQLLYLEQLKHVNSNYSDESLQRRRVQRKISKIEEDGKPEWMLHITPPRIPYNVMEKMRCDEQSNYQQMLYNVNSMEISTIQRQQQDFNEKLQESHQKSWKRVDGMDFSQQQQPFSFINVPKVQQTCNMTRLPGAQCQNQFYAYPAEYKQQEQHEGQIERNKWQVQSNIATMNNLIENNREPGQLEQLEKKIEPSSLLKLRLYKEVIRRQKQNNGLQDLETVKEVLECLNNSTNRKGLEYLDNLNKPEKTVLLNGAQEPHEIAGLLHKLQRDRCIYQPTKNPSANGLENHRNSNNPLPPSILRRRNNDTFQVSEYPRQKSKNFPSNCYNLIAEKENGTVAKSATRNYNNPSYSMNLQPGFENLQYPVQRHHGVHFKSEKTDYDQYRNYLAQLQRNYHNGDTNCCINPQRMANLQQEKHQLPKNFQENDNIHEVMMIGGVKYLARRPEYLPRNSSIPTRNFFNPTISY